MSEWAETTLGRIATLTIGRTPDRKNAAYWTSDTSFPFCTIADMPAQTWSISPKREGVTQAAIDAGKAKLAPAGSLLMSFKLTIGRVGFAQRDVYPNEAIVRIDTAARPDVDPQYLAAWLESNDLTENAPRAVKGKTLNSASLAAIRVVLPPIPVQERIVEVIGAVDDQIAALDGEAEAGEAFRGALLSDLLDRLEGVAESTLGGVADWTSGSTPKATDRSYYSGGDIPWAIIGDVRNAPIRDTANKITEDGLYAIGGKRKIAPVGAVLVSMYGSVGRSAVAQIPMATNQAIARGVPNEKVSSEYLFLWVNAHEADLDQMARGATQRNINKRMVMAFPILVPSRDAQDAIVGTISVLDEKVAATRAEVERLRAVRASLLTGLLTPPGEPGHISVEMIEKEAVGG